MNKIKCIDCPYWWGDDIDNTKYCHYFREDGCAPCEIDERETNEKDGKNE